eukprot:scaffold8533_cov248-Pinguiococcus_pyrenoidosus.AAC.3
MSASERSSGRPSSTCSSSSECVRSSAKRFVRTPMKNAGTAEAAEQSTGNVSQGACRSCNFLQHNGRQGADASSAPPRCCASRGGPSRGTARIMPSPWPSSRLSSGGCRSTSSNGGRPWCCCSCTAGT